MDNMLNLSPALFEREPWRFSAETVYERIEKLVNERMNALNADEELSITVPVFDGTRIAVQGFGYQNPNFILAYGIDSKTGISIEAYLSHMTVQLIFTITKKLGESRRAIGFRD